MTKWDNPFPKAYHNIRENLFDLNRQKKKITVHDIIKTYIPELHLAHFRGKNNNIEIPLVVAWINEGKNQDGLTSEKWPYTLYYDSFKRILSILEKNTENKRFLDALDTIVHKNTQYEKLYELFEVCVSKLLEQENVSNELLELSAQEDIFELLTLLKQGERKQVLLKYDFFEYLSNNSELFNRNELSNEAFILENTWKFIRCLLKILYQDKEDIKEKEDLKERDDFKIFWREGQIYLRIIRMLRKIKKIKAAGKLPYGNNSKKLGTRICPKFYLPEGLRYFDEVIEIYTDEKDMSSMSGELMNQHPNLPKEIESPSLDILRDFIKETYSDLYKRFNIKKNSTFMIFLNKFPIESFKKNKLKKNKSITKQPKWPLITSAVSDLYEEIIKISKKSEKQGFNPVFGIRIYRNTGDKETYNGNIHEFNKSGDYQTYCLSYDQLRNIEKGHEPFYNQKIELEEFQEGSKNKIKEIENLLNKVRNFRLKFSGSINDFIENINTFLEYILKRKELTPYIYSAEKDRGILKIIDRAVRNLIDITNMLEREEVSIYRYKFILRKFIEFSEYIKKYSTIFEKEIENLSREQIREWVRHQFEFSFWPADLGYGYTVIRSGLPEKAQNWETDLRTLALKGYPAGLFLCERFPKNFLYFPIKYRNVVLGVYGVDIDVYEKIERHEILSITNRHSSRIFNAIINTEMQSFIKEMGESTLGQIVKEEKFSTEGFINTILTYTQRILIYLAQEATAYKRSYEEINKIYKKIKSELEITGHKSIIVTERNKKELRLYFRDCLDFIVIETKEANLPFIKTRIDIYAEVAASLYNFAEQIKEEKRLRIILIHLLKNFPHLTLKYILDSMKSAVQEETLKFILDSIKLPIQDETLKYISDSIKSSKKEVMKKVTPVGYNLYQHIFQRGLFLDKIPKIILNLKQTNEIIQYGETQVKDLIENIQQNSESCLFYTLGGNLNFFLDSFEESKKVWNKIFKIKIINEEELSEFFVKLPTEWKGAFYTIFENFIHNSLVQVLYFEEFEPYDTLASLYWNTAEEEKYKIKREKVINKLLQDFNIHICMSLLNKEKKEVLLKKLEGILKKLEKKKEDKVCKLLLSDKKILCIELGDNGMGFDQKAKDEYLTWLEQGPENPENNKGLGIWSINQSVNFLEAEFILWVSEIPQKKYHEYGNFYKYKYYIIKEISAMSSSRGGNNDNKNESFDN